MFNKRALSKIATVLAIVVIVVVAAVGVYFYAAPVPASAPTTTIATLETTAALATTAKKIRFAVIFITPVEEPWNSILVQALDRAKAELGIEYDYTESVSIADAERVMRGYAESGKYDCLISHAWFVDAVKAVQKDYPNWPIIWSGTGLAPIPGTKVSHLDYYLQDPSYVGGVLAALLTKTGRIAAIGGFPVSNHNAAINGFIAGARSVNPDIKWSATYLESWFDPPKAKEAAIAQAEAGADILFAMGAYGAIDGAVAKKIFVIPTETDQASVAPDYVLGSATADWYPAVRAMTLDLERETWGAREYNFTMAQGATRWVWNPNIDKMIPGDIKAKVDELTSKVMSGQIVPPYIVEEPTKYWSAQSQTGTELSLVQSETVIMPQKTFRRSTWPCGETYARTT